MSDFGNGHNITTRKNHRCEWCFEPIPASSLAFYYHGMFGGDWQNWYMHPECLEAHQQDGGDEFMPGEGTRPAAKKATE